MPLVNYDSSSSDESNPAVSIIPSKHMQASSLTVKSDVIKSGTAGSKRKRGLPKLPSEYSTANPNDDPKQHRGRTRSRPYVDGDYNAHIYISLEISRQLRKTIADIIDVAQTLCPGYPIHSLISTSPDPSLPSLAVDNENPREHSISQPLHISLTHPLPLRRSQILSFRDDLRCALQPARTSRGGIRDEAVRLSLAGDVVGFINGRRSGGEGKGGRAFLALRVSAGSPELSRLLEKAIHPILSKSHLPLYHTNPTFHTSFAWCLLDPQNNDSREASSDSFDDTDLDAGSLVSQDQAKSPFTPKVLDELSERFGRAILAEQPVGGWNIKNLELKVGKEVHILPLS